MKLFDEVASKIVAGDGGPQLLLSQSLGYDGSGVNVAVADSGLNNGDAATMHPDLFGRTPAFFYYGSLTDAADEHSHGTHVSGIVAGNGATGETDSNGALYGLGVAPGASIIAQRIFDGAGNFEPPPSFERLTRDATRAGAVIGSNSWGDDTQGQYDVSAMEFDELVRDADALALGDQPYILEFSAGNAGPAPQTIGSPAVAKNVIATGASENDREDFLVYDDGPDAMADFSSRGPCADGRIKPDVVAPGTWISSLQSESATDQYAWEPIDSNYQYQGGTSQAGPHASGAAAVFVQFYRQSHTNSTPSPALVKAALINAATDMDDSVETGPVPNMDEGWGRVDLTPFFDSSLAFDYVDQTVPLTNGQVFERHLIVGGSSQPLKVTLAYTDVPGFPGATVALVNDLDLEVVSPDGHLYRGNQFDGADSLPDTLTPDTINNVEAVHIFAPVPGDYIVRVRASHVVQDGVSSTAAVDQDFALVTSAQIAVAGVGTVLLDRGSYRAPSQIRITLIDSDLATNLTASVQAVSTTEPNGENVLLHANGSTGIFTGAIATASGPPILDGTLQIANNDVIQVRYFDASGGVTRTATAVGDFVAPVLSAVASSGQFGQVVITWQSTEPATSIVRYNTNSTLVNAITNSVLTTDHSVTLTGLIPGKTYYFLVAGSDEAGNVGTNNNGGTLFSLVVAQPRTALLVDGFVSNGFDEDIPLSVYTNTLNAIGITYDVWDPSVIGYTPSTNDLRPYQVVIWRFNDGVFSAETLSGADQDAVRAYLDQGGAFFMSSMEQLTRLGNGFFRNQVLHVSNFNEDVGVDGVTGVTGDSITSGMMMDLTYTQYSNFWHDALGVPDDISDTMLLAPEASSILVDSSFGDVAGMKFPRTGQDSKGRVVYLSFPLDAVSDTDAAPNNRATLLRNIISFLVPGVNGRGTVALDSPAYNIPSTATVEVGDSDLAGHGTTSITFASTTQPTGLTITLNETSRKGLFRGTVGLISSTNPPTAGKLRVKNGDQLTASYFDASANSTVQANAVVDTTPPTISNVSAEPDFESAVISWTTSEPSDSLVQFGSSVLLGRTAYDPTLTTSHYVELDELLPNSRTYYQVVSTDDAGNTTTDDNQGRLYSFRTLVPLVAPWSDNMDTGATNWTVFNADSAQSAWTLGPPNNQLGTNNAHSRPNAWGSNLNGQPIDYSETFLISPAIYLTNGNVATLRFWHNYDFSDLTGYDIESGEVQVVTNNASAPVPIADFGDVSSGWELAELDLTPFVGRVIYLVWYYQLFSTDTLSRPGWLVDDVSVTVSNVQPGTVTIANNLWQTVYILSGPAYLKGKGLGTVITNAPPGQYIMEYADVPYYQTPATQTNTLVSGATINFTGNYTFSDVNSNGISDAWEMHFFGAVSTNRTRLTDTDHDGMTDYAEFMAGTDPNNPVAPVRLSMTQVSNSVCRLQWPSTVGQTYRVDSSTNLTAWSPYTGWLQATNAVTRLDIAIPSAGPRSFFRIEQPVTPSDLAPNFKVSAQRITGGAVRLQWNSSVGRGYQVSGSTNGAVWVPVSDWIQAAAASTAYTLPPPTSGSPFMFRVEVRP
jgi:hypothetical protein